jgi:relaxase-like protein
VIAPVCPRGHRLRGLIEYLYGPGKYDEHTNPHLVAAWNEEWLSSSQNKAERGRLTRQMQLPRRLFGVQVPKGPVYHVVCSVGPEDGLLGDDAWRRVAERAAEKLELTPAEGRAGCRWIAVHHGLSRTGNDHIHFVVEPVREDGTLVDLYNDWPRLGQMCTEMEHELGLRALDRGKKHGERGVKRAELGAAERRGHPEPDRTALARRVRAAAAGARGEAEFLTRLRRDRVLVRPRWAAGQRAGDSLEQVVGYSVALRPPWGEKPVWYGGGRLGRDLSLPALRQRWPNPSPAEQAEALALWRPKRWRREPAARIPRARRLHPRAWEAAGEQVAATRRRLAAIGSDDRALWASAAREASGTLSALARRLQPGQRAELARAADALARAGQLPPGQRRGHRDPALAAMSGVARVVTDAVLVTVPGLAAATLIRQVVEFAAEVGNAHAAAGRAAEAAAGRAAAEHALAYTRAATGPDATGGSGGIGETAPSARTSGDTERVPPRAPAPGGQQDPARWGSRRRRPRQAGRGEWERG